MKIFAVGGVIRDQLLGLPSADADYVVVGATPEEMSRLGFRAVGSDFPVFLHPQTHEEYALARTERKTGKGYKGFSFYAAPNVTLEEDLLRRDLTINAMAQEVDDQGCRFGPIIDPYNGQEDLKNKIFKHVGPAFNEDPLRVLRIARFAARFADFKIHSETQQLLSQMAAAGELKDLVPERVWQEISRGLIENKPSRMLEVLHSCGAITQLFPEDLQKQEIFKTTCIEIDLTAKKNLDLKLRFAALMSGVDFEQAKTWYDTQRIPLEERAYAEIFRIWRHQYASAEHIDAQKMMLFFDRADLWRKPERLQKLFELAIDLGLNAKLWLQAMEALSQVDAGKIAKSLLGKSGEEIKKAVFSARLKVLEAFL